MRDSVLPAQSSGAQAAKAYRRRRREGAVVVAVEVPAQNLAELERLGLLRVGDRSKPGVASAVMRFLAGASSMAMLGDALWPPDQAEDA